MSSYVYNPNFLLHNPGPRHPESPERLEAVMRRLAETGLLDRLRALEARPATTAELEAVHTPEYLARLEEMSGRGGGELDADTTLSAESWTAARYAAGGAVAAVEAVMEGDAPNSLVLSRPPGHHAFAGRGSGFCLLNHVAVAAAVAARKYRLERVAVIDWDVHHGNGTQAIFDSRPEMLHVSLHQYPHYPGTGAPGDTGRVGNLLNIPLTPGSGDDQYLEVFRERVVPAVRRFAPELLLISAGYDGHWADPLSAMRLSVSGYAEMTAAVKSLAEECCDGRLVLILEGGYHHKALAASVAAAFSVLLDEPWDDPLGPSPV